MKEYKKFIYGFAILLIMALLIHLGYKCSAIPYDDAYTVFMIKKSYTEILSITATDVHPPLYYWGLKTFSILFGDSFFALRIFSLLGIAAAILLACFPIRRLFGFRIAAVFTLLLLLFPVTQYLVTDIRMYSWTMFFVLACALFAYDVYRKGRVIDWIKFFISGLCAAYLHNFGLLSVFWIYVLLFIVMLKNGRRWQHLLACGLIFSVAYLPWLLQLVAQVNNVSGDYWIKPLTLNDLFLHIYYFYSPKEVWLPFTDFSKTQMMAGLIILMSVQFILTLNVFFTGIKKQAKSAILSLLAFVAFILPIVTGFLISVLFTPISVVRYMTCSFGLFILSIAFVLDRIYEYRTYRKLLYLFILLLFLDGALRYRSNLIYYNETNIVYSDIAAFIDADNRHAELIVANDFSFYVIPRLQLIAPNSHYAVLGTYDRILNSEPFRFDVIHQLPSVGFVLVNHYRRESVQKNFRQFQDSLSSYYITVDSLQIEEFSFYKMQRK